MMKNTSEDYPPPVPREGIPYAPAWDGRGEGRCAAWSVYVPGGELLKAQVGESTLEICRARAVGKPAVIQTGDACWQVAVPLYRDRKWYCRRFAVTPSRVVVLSDLSLPGAFIASVRLFLDAEGDVLLALALEQDGVASVQVFKYSGENAERILTSPAELHAHRLAAAMVGGNPAVVYDAWDGRAYHVYMQTGETPIRLSEGEGWHTAPDIVTDIVGRSWVAWLRTSDVTNQQGVFDARCEIMLVRVTSRPGSEPDIRPFGAVADLSHGLMDVSPDPQSVWGYLGRRRHPMLLRTPAGVELLWEQKDVHNESTLKNFGVLWARRVTSDGVGEVRALAEGALWYEVPGSRLVESERFALCCFEGIAPDPRRVHFKKIAETPLLKKRLPKESWRGWTPVTLPLPEMRIAERPRIVADGKTFHLYWFDLHCHTILSADADGDLDECYRTARCKALLDGVLMTDNDYLYGVALSKNEWRTNCALAEAFNEPGRFVTLIGYEWTSRPLIGGKLVTDHRSVLLPRPTEDIVRWNEVAADDGALYAFVEKEGGFTHAHHQNWRLKGHPVEVNIEGASSWDAYLERDPSCFHEHLKKGHKIGVIGGSDEHRRNPGLGGSLTGIWAESLTRESIMEALCARRCYVTNGRRALIDFRANGRPMGETVKGPLVSFNIRVRSPAPIMTVELVRDGEAAERWAVGGAAEFATDYQESVDETAHFFYLKVILEGEDYDRKTLPANLQQVLGARAWSSPIWVSE